MLLILDWFCIFSFRCLWILSSLRSLFYPLILGPLYLIIGPWTAGYFLDHSLGILFLWGLYVENTVLPSTIASVYALIYIIPYTYIFIGLLNLKIHLSTNGNSDRKCVYILNFMFLLYMIVQFFHSLGIYYSLGFLECLGVCGLVKIIYFYYCWTQVNVTLIKQSLTDEYTFPHYWCLISFRGSFKTASLSKVNNKDLCPT